MNRYTIYCTEEQTRKALELGAPIIEMPFRAAFAPDTCDKYGFIHLNNTYYVIPTTEQMREWLRREHKILCNVVDEYSHGEERSVYYIEVDKGGNNIFRSSHECELSHDNAVMCVINLALEYLSNNKK